MSALYVKQGNLKFHNHVLEHIIAKNNTNLKVLKLIWETFELKNHTDKIKIITKVLNATKNQ